MALTESQKADVRLYLGFERSVDMHPALETRFASGDLTAEEETRLAAVLATIAAIDAKLQSAALRNLDAAKVDEVTLLGPAQLAALRKQGRMLVGRVAILFAVDPARDYFDEGGGSLGGVLSLG